MVMSQGKKKLVVLTGAGMSAESGLSTFRDADGLWENEPVAEVATHEAILRDPARCIRCCACVKGCAFGARTFRTPFAAALARNFARRKPPVTLL